MKDDVAQHGKEMAPAPDDKKSPKKGGGFVQGRGFGLITGAADDEPSVSGTHYSCWSLYPTLAAALIGKIIEAG